MICVKYLLNYFFILVAMQNTHYERLGGEATVRRLVDRFYQLMDQLAEADDIRKLHADDLTEASGKLFMFLSGWLGGPQLYLEKYGHPRLRQRHMPFNIGEKNATSGCCA